MRPAYAPVLAIASLAALLPAAPSIAAAPRTHVIVMDKMKFGPSPAQVRVGDTIVWVNKDLFRHTATAKDRSFDVDLAAGKKASMVVRKSGAIPFVCKFHPGMRGVLKVAAK